MEESSPVRIIMKLPIWNLATLCTNGNREAPRTCFICRCRKPEEPATEASYQTAHLRVVHRLEPITELDQRRQRVQRVGLPALVALIEVAHHRHVEQLLD